MIKININITTSKYDIIMIFPIRVQIFSQVYGPSDFDV